MHHRATLCALAVGSAALFGCRPSEETTVVQTVESGPLSPTILEVEPSMGSTLGGTSVLLSGIDFASGATVMFGTTEAVNVDVASGSTLFCDTPPGTVGLADITVTNPGDQIGIRRKAWE